MPPPPVRLSIIGFGEIGQRHAELITANADCSLAGICDVDPRCQPYADKFGVPIYKDVKELLEREKPRGAIIATPNRQHAAIAELCAKHSIHILIEKPIADSMEGANRIVKAADDNRVQVLVGHHRRHNSLVQQTRLALQSGELGKLTAVSMLWTLMKPSDYYQKQWRCTPPGGGPTFINLVHELDLVRYLCGEVRQVYAQASSAARQLAVEDTLSISLALSPRTRPPHPGPTRPPLTRIRSIFPRMKTAIIFLAHWVPSPFPKCSPGGILVKKHPAGNIRWKSRKPSSFGPIHSSPSWNIFVV